MGRAKVKLERIAKERSRNTTFQKRKKGLKKKIYEFSTLCGVDACLIIFGPNQGDALVQPETWPESHEDVVNIIEQFRKHSREEQGKRQIGLPQFFEDQTKKLRSELVKLRNRNGKVKYPTWDDSINNFSETQLRSLVASLNSKLELVKLRIDLSERNPVLDDVTGLIEYSVPPMNQYLPPPPPCWDSSNSSIMDDMLLHMHNNHQPLSYLKPLDHRHRLPIDYVPSDPSDLVFQTTMVDNGIDCTGDQYGASRSIVPYHPAAVVGPMSTPIYYNPMLPTSDEMAMLNNTGGGPLPLPYYYSTNMQQPMMHSYFAQQLYPISEFSDFQDYPRL